MKLFDGYFGTIGRVYDNGKKEIVIEGNLGDATLCYYRIGKIEKHSYSENYMEHRNMFAASISLFCIIFFGPMDISATLFDSFEWYYIPLYFPPYYYLLEITCVGLIAGIFYNVLNLIFCRTIVYISFTINGKIEAVRCEMDRVEYNNIRRSIRK